MTSFLGGLADVVGDALGGVSYEIGSRVKTLPVPAGSKSSPECATRTLAVSLSHVQHLTTAEYRFGDLTKGLFNKITDEEKILRPYVRITVDRSWGRSRTLDVTQGSGRIDETLLLALPATAGGAALPALEFSVYNKVGVQSAIRGDPLIGSAKLSAWSPSQRVHLLTLTRDGKARGKLQVCGLAVETRPDRSLALLKASLLTSVVGTHWGLAIDQEVYEMVAVGNANGGPTALIGPRGLIASTVAAEDWLPWKLALIAQRARQGFLAADAREYHERNEPIPDGELRRLMPSRPLEGFDAKQAKLPERTLRTDEEIEAFSILWAHQNPVYDSIDANCQRYIKDLHNFLTCGRWLQYPDLHEAFNVLSAVGTTVGSVGVAGVAVVTVALAGPVLGLAAIGSSVAAGAAGAALAGSLEAEAPEEGGVTNDTQLASVMQDSLQVAEKEANLYQSAIEPAPQPAVAASPKPANEYAAPVVFVEVD